MRGKSQLDSLALVDCVSCFIARVAGHRIDPVVRSLNIHFVMLGTVNVHLISLMPLSEDSQPTLTVRKVS